MVYKNKKNGEAYLVVDTGVVNCTNSVDGQEMIAYTKVGSTQLFVREKGEFHEKFEKI